jgi:O-Antigen ligase
VSTLALPGAGATDATATGVSAARTSVAARSHPVLILQCFALALWIIPSSYVIRPIGDLGYPAGLIGMFAFVVWLGATLLGYHNPRARRHPMRAVLSLFWLVSFGSYLLIDRTVLNSHELLGADRWLMQLGLMTGVALLAAECLDSLADIRRVLRPMVWGAAFSGAVGAVQYWGSFDPTTWAKYLPGFSLSADDPSILLRAGMNRVSGTAIDPIELGVTASIMLPLAIYLAIYDRDRSNIARWLPVLLIGIAVMVSVSRSAILGIAISVAVLMVLMPLRQRLVAITLLPVALVGVFMSAHGLIGTLAAFFGYGSADPSITHRTDNYPYVWNLVRQAPLLGHGGGTYIPATQVHILDNEYLTTAINLGVLGVLVLIALFVVPLITALAGRMRTDDPELRLLLAALAAGCASALVCSATFDSFSFPVFYCTFALVMGLVGAGWQLARKQGSPTPGNDVLALVGETERPHPPEQLDVNPTYGG